MNAYLYTSSRAMHSEILNLLLPQVGRTHLPRAPALMPPACGEHVACVVRIEQACMLAGKAHMVFHVCRWRAWPLTRWAASTSSTTSASPSSAGEAPQT